MIELVVVMVLMGILAVNAMPQFFSASRFDEMGFADAAAGALRYARRLALVSRCDTRVEIGSFGYRLRQRATACDSGALTRDVLRPGGGNWADPAPGGVTPAAVDIYFDALGQPIDTASGTALTAPLPVAVGSRTITLEPVTGFVHQL